MLTFHRYGNGLPILFLHGWGFDHKIWHCLRKVWPSEWQMITVDIPGHGQTPSMTMESFASEILLQLPKTFSVVGWSLGGLYAFHLMEKASYRIQHLFAVSTSPSFVRQNDWPGIEENVLSRFYLRYVRTPYKTVNEFIESQFFCVSRKQKIDYSPILPSDAKLGLTLLKECDFRSQIKNRANVISFLLGKQDAIVPVSLAHVLPKYLNVNDVCILKKCGHMPFLTHDELFIKHLGERLK